MIYRSLLASTCILTCSALAAFAQAEPPLNKPHSQTNKSAQHLEANSVAHLNWSYAGATGPEHWGDKDRANAACKHGTQQSPIDLSHAISAFASSPQIDWKPFSSGEVVNTGHTLQLNVENAGGLVRDGKAYELVHFHFHTPSEHTIDGHHFPMEAQFVHKAQDGTIATTSVMFAEGANNPNLDPLWWSAPPTAGSASVAFNLDIEDLLPTNRSAFMYRGSLTTPPCTEIVDWTIYKTPMIVSKAQIATFRALFGDNARPVQPSYRRFVLETP